MDTDKDEATAELRRAIIEGAEYLVETDRAAPLTITLSFQSRIDPKRHVWIDTQMGEDGTGCTADLEDWAHEGGWDNAVATIDTADADAIREVTQAWLRGEPLDACLQRCAHCKVERK